MKKKLTVIVPVYNVEKYLQECLTSLHNQTFKAMKVIVVNDGSTDGSLDIAEKFAKEYPDQFTVLSKPNGGLSDARNFAIPLVDTEWIAFLDSDDWADPEYYEKMAERMEEGNDVVVSDIQYFYESGEPSWIMKGLNVNQFDSVNQQAFLSPMFAWNKVYRTEFFSKMNYRYPVGTWYEDIPVTMPIFARSHEIACQHEALIHYRQREGSIMSAKKSQRLKEIFPVMKMVRDQFDELGLSEKYHDELEYLHIEHLRLYGMFRFMRSPLFEELWKMSDEVMNQYYPHWKQNRYLCTLGLKNRVFLQTFGKLTVPLYRRIIK